MALDCAGKILHLSHVTVMGVLNVTPDSFYDGGRFVDPGLALERAQIMEQQGAAIIDVGGESTRPGAEVVSEEEELRRVIPVIQRLARHSKIPVSIDTSKAEVMRQAVHHGAGMINDVYSLRQQGALKAAQQCKVPVCIMHLQGEPRTMQHSPLYEDVVGDVRKFLIGQTHRLEQAGIGRERIIIDPGFGFGKTVDHNLQLLRELKSFVQLGYPVLAGLSRKSMIGKILNRDVTQRLGASLALAMLAAQNGAHIIRVHDVLETVDALAMMDILGTESKASA